ncbi:MAG: ABC transporter substrate-binding protein [Candidatus Enterosoma sp.]|nr:ABC transporter substrate-binding protein [bacterium]MDY4549758.1 ABC transporter substrate-binding protein [Candidatus Enterosoma sp.]
MKRSKFVILSLASVMLAGCGGAEKLEDELNLLAGCEEPYMNAVADAFAAKYNVKVNRIRKSSGEIETQIKNEKGTPSADVLFGGTTDPYNALKAEGLLEKYVSKNDAKISDAHFKDADHYWYGIYKGILGFMWNKDKLQELGLTAPKTWDDLIKPEYSKYITWSHPSTAGTAKLVVNTIVQKKAEGKKTTYKNEDGETVQCYDDTAAMEWFKKLDANTAKYTKSGSGASKEVGVGTTIIGIGFLHDVIYQIVDKKYTNIGMCAPEDGTSYEVGATAICKGAKHPNLAKKFIDFATSAECVELGQKNGSYQFLVVDGAHQPQAAIDAGISNVNVMDYDFEDAKTNISHYVEDFNAAVKAEIPTA